MTTQSSTSTKAAINASTLWPKPTREELFTSFGPLCLALKANTNLRIYLVPGDMDCFSVYSHDRLIATTNKLPQAMAIANARHQQMTLFNKIHSSAQAAKQVDNAEAKLNASDSPGTLEDSKNNG